MAKPTFVDPTKYPAFRYHWPREAREIHGPDEEEDGWHDSPAKCVEADGSVSDAKAKKKKR